MDYNMQHEIVKQFIGNRSTNGGVKEFICRPCRHSLSKNKPTYPKHALCEKHSCISCHGSFHQAQLVTFDIDNYNRNSNMVKRLLGCNRAQSNGYVCKQCDKKLLHHNIVQCSKCRKYIKQYSARIMKNNTNINTNIDDLTSKWICQPCNSALFDYILCVACHHHYPKHRIQKLNLEKYDTCDDIVESTLCGAVSDSDFICIGCDKQLMKSYICTCCHNKYNRYRVKPFDSTNYDFGEYIVSRALASKHRLVHGEVEYICYVCDRNLATSENHTPKMPQKAFAHGCVIPGSKFLQAIREKPEFVCTCCHRWMFHRSVIQYNSSVYNMENDTVKQVLHDTCHYPMDVQIMKGHRSAHQHPVHYGDSDSDLASDEDGAVEEIDNQYSQSSHTAYNDEITYKWYEYICLTCHRNLKKKMPKMPPQAYANCMALSEVPPELLNLSDLERRIISLRIPFMVIFCLVRYGSQYKIRGGCTNVPSSLDQIVDILPRMPNDIQFHPMKLKKKMCYKSNYMYNYIRKDVVIAAIKWLKENNKLYNEIELNDSWADDWINSDYSSFLQVGEHENFGLPDDCVSDVGFLGGQGADECAENSLDRSNDNEHRELNEDQNATDANLQVVGRPTSNMLQYENLEQEIYTCAPGENNTPRYMLMDDTFEELAFPDMFPYGCCGYSTSGFRKSKLSLRKYFNQRLLNVDGQFANNIEYLFCAQYATEIKQIQADSNIAL